MITQQGIPEPRSFKSNNGFSKVESTIKKRPPFKIDPISSLFLEKFPKILCLNYFTRPHRSIKILTLKSDL